MFRKGAKLYSSIHNKCPRCQEGDFFVNNKAFKLKNNLKIYENCPNCGLKYMLEPSFFYGAMYVSYALTVAMAVAIFVVCYLLGIGLLKSFVVIIVALILFMPFTMRISRLLYINMFVSYEEKK